MLNEMQFCVAVVIKTTSTMIVQDMSLCIYMLYRVILCNELVSVQVYQ